MTLGLATREAFGRALVELGRERRDLVALDGDVNNSTFTELFKKEFPDRFFNVGIAESNLIGVAAGLAACDKVPFVASFACFILCNAFDQLRMSVAFPRLPVKVVGSHAGISIGEDGPSQMAIEDVALALALPGFAVAVPADEQATRAAVRALADYPGPTYLRVGRPKAPIVYPEGSGFTLGKATCLRAGDSVTVIANGLMVAAALEAGAELEQEGIAVRVLDCASVRPLDEAAIVAAARETGAVVVAEEHLRQGALGAAVAQVLARNQPVPVEFVALDGYAESGKPDELMRAYHLTAADIVAAVRRVRVRKGPG